MEATTERRMREGEADHLIFYLLQSTSFTSAPRIEPAASAKACRDAGAIPSDVRRRMSDFLAAKVSNPRMDYFRKLAGGRKGLLEDEYMRAMAFLYEKEFLSLNKRGQERRDYVASLYQKRGHSTDTSEAATKAMELGMGVLLGIEPEFQIRRVLLIGPGLDFSPRTGLDESYAPRSYQPLALAAGNDYAIHCVDINPRVVESIGNSGRFTAERVNVLTAKPKREEYDVVIATNVLLYFNKRELAMAINYIYGSLREGGYFLHNDLRGEMEEFTKPMGFGPIDGRMVKLPSQGRVELFDSFVLHRKEGR
jgi:hypothetical protein